MREDDQPTRPQQAERRSSAALEELVAACLEARIAGERERAEALLAAHPDLARAARAQLDDLASTGLIEDEPVAIGPYRVLELLGRGGMGEVYLAEQREPVERKVAVKLVKRGMDTREVLARFSAERQALARMSHPAIARVFDAGSTEDGRPYFAMEHVPGLPVTAYCDRRSLDTGARLALFLGICEGVQHAHLKGILHRDLKPSNLLVTEVDGKPSPKIIDFGIAKAIDHNLAGATLHTSRGVILGTPEYMSPEQAGRDGLDLDLRTDVYSLGVVLYELLTGALPFAAERLRTDVARLQQILREEDPAAPSRRVSANDEDTAQRAKRRRATHGELRRRLRGDLDWICLKALAKDREDRYASVGELAADIQRHLANEPVLAGPPSGFYRLRKYVRRHRLQVFSALLILGSLVAGLVVSLIFRGRAEDEAARARESLVAESTARGAEQSARAAAERDFAHALEAVQVLLTQVADARLDGAPRMEHVRREILEEARRFCHTLLEDRGDEPRALEAAATAHTVLSSIAQSLDDTAEALHQCELADELWQKRIGGRTDAWDARFQRARTLDTWGQALHSLDREDEARSKFVAALEEYRAILATKPDDVSARKHCAAELCQIGNFERTRDPALGLQWMQKAREELELARANGAEPKWVQRLHAVLEVNAIAAHYSLGDTDGAEAALERARAALAFFDLPESWDVDLLEAGTEVERKASILHYRKGRALAAQEAGRAFVANAERLRRDHPAVPRYVAMVAEAYGNLAIFLRNESDEEASLEAFRSAAEVCCELANEHPEDGDYARSSGTYAGNYAYALLLTSRRSHLEEARRYATIALERAEAAYQGRELTTSILETRTNVRLQWAEIERADGFAERALPIVEEALALFAGAPSSIAKHARVFETHVGCALLAAECAIEVGEIARARPPLDAALEMLSAREDRLSQLENPAGMGRLVALYEARWQVSTGVAERILEAVRRLDAGCSDEPWRCRTGALPPLLRAAELASEGERAAILAAAEVAARAAFAAVDAALVETADDADLEEAKLLTQLATARLRALTGERDAARALLDPALEPAIARRRDAHVSPWIEDELARALELAREIARERGERERELRCTRLFFELAVPRHAARGAELVLAAEGTAAALELLERRAQRAPPLRREEFSAACFAPLRAEARFEALFAAKR